jgi:hypothetical protein
VSRQAEVYLLAANYLQTLEWRSAPELTKNIVLFYTKAGAHDSLARFYESCAELEIDATKDYAKALQVGAGGVREGGDDGPLETSLGLQYNCNSLDLDVPARECNTVSIDAAAASPAIPIMCPLPLPP